MLTREQAKQVDRFLAAAEGECPYKAIEAVGELLSLIGSSIIIDDFGNREIVADAGAIGTLVAAQVAASILDSRLDDGEQE